MNSRVEEIFLEALELEPGERVRFATEACGSNEALLREVLQWLSDSEMAERFFESDATGVFQPMERPGDTVGPFTLVRELGEGGFGVVWLARQERPIARQVALKVIKAGMDTREVLARFDAERQALARMEHPNIARVLDAGTTPNGRPYFAMELVAGVPITAFCDKHALGIDQRLELFLQVCGAVSHAHQKGVVHRDLKPSNILVIGDVDAPRIKVIDFGIAKAVEGRLADVSFLTRVEQLVGTPAYMSPEQAGLAEGDIDTRSDVYSMGILLYELLTGFLPFDRRTLLEAGRDEIRRIIREVDPPRPSQRITEVLDEGTISAEQRDTAAGIRRRITNELDWVIMKAIAKERDRRYQSAEALADDLRRHLADEPVSAKPPAFTYLLGKFLRRHRSAALAGLVVLLALVGATLVSLLHAARATRAEALANKRLAETIAEREAKDAALRAKESALEETAAVSNLFVDVFRRPDPDVDGRTLTVAEALDRANLKMEAQLKNKPAQLAALQEALASTYRGLGLLQEALGLRRKVYKSRILNLGEKADDSFKAMDALLEALNELCLYDEARDLARQKLALREATAFSPKDPRIFEARFNYLGCLFKSGAHEEAIQVARDFLEKAKGDPTQAPGFKNWLDNLLRATGRAKEIEPDEPVPPGRLPPPGTKTNDIEYQRRLAQQTAELRRKVEEAKAQGATASPEYFELLRQYGSALFAGSNPKEALVPQSELVEAFRAKYGEKHPRTLEAEDQLAYLGWKSREWRRSMEESGALLGRTRSALGPEHEQTVLLESEHALKLFCHGQIEEAAQMAERAMAALTRICGTHDRSTAHAVSTLGRCRAAQGRTEEALALMEQCGPDMPDDTFLNMSLAKTQLWTGRIDAYDRTRDWMLKYGVAEAPTFTRRQDILYRNVTIACYAPFRTPKQKESAKKIMERALEIDAAQAKHQPGDIADIQMALGLLQLRCGEEAQAVEALKKSIEVRLKLKRDRWNKSQLIQARLCMALALKGLGKAQEAHAACGEALALMKEFERPSVEQPLLNIHEPSGSPLEIWIFQKETEAALGLIGGN